MYNLYVRNIEAILKGVVLSHEGILANCEGAMDLLEPLIKKKDPIFLTWLPLSHSYEHAVQHSNNNRAKKFFTLKV